jgi:nucleoside-diphosphate-sugar epimerase
MMKKIIVTGATGFIGGALTKRLLADGAKVYGVGRNARKLEELNHNGNFIPIIADFEMYNRLHEIITDRDFDVVYYLAWNGTSTNSYNDYGIQLINIKAVCDIVTSLAFLRCNRFIFCTSNYQRGVVNDDSVGVFNPIIYGIIKRAASDLIKAIAYQNNISWMSLIFPNVYGPGDKLNTAVLFFIKNLIAGKPLNLISGVYPDDWMFIDDLVEGILRAAQSKRECVDYYIGHRNITTFKEKLLSMKEILYSSSELNFGAYPEKYHVDYNSFDLDALFRNTGYESKTDFKESLIKTAEWVKLQS